MWTSLSSVAVSSRNRGGLDDKELGVGEGNGSTMAAELMMVPGVLNDDTLSS